MDQKVRTKLKWQLKGYYQSLRDQFASYVSFVYISLKRKGISAEELCTFLTQLPAFDIEYDGLNPDKRKCPLITKEKLENATSIAKIFSILQTYSIASYLNYGIYESIIKQYELDSTHSDLKYPEYFCAYAKKHKISEILEVMEGKKMSAEATVSLEEQELSFKFDYDPNTMPFSAIVELKYAIASALELNPDSLRLFSIEEGCVVVNFLISIAIADQIFSDESCICEKKEALRNLSALWLKYGSMPAIVLDSIEQKEDGEKGRQM